MRVPRANAPRAFRFKQIGESTAIQAPGTAGLDASSSILVQSINLDAVAGADTFEPVFDQFKFLRVVRVFTVEDVLDSAGDGVSNDMITPLILTFWKDKEAATALTQADFLSRRFSTKTLSKRGDTFSVTVPLWRQNTDLGNMPKWGPWLDNESGTTAAVHGAMLIQATNKAPVAVATQQAWNFSVRETIDVAFRSRV